MHPGPFLGNDSPTRGEWAMTTVTRLQHTPRGQQRVILEVTVPVCRCSCLGEGTASLGGASNRGASCTQFFWQVLIKPGTRASQIQSHPSARFPTLVLLGETD